MQKYKYKYENNNQKGNVLVMAAVIGAIAAVIVFGAYQIFAPNRNNSNSDFVLPTENENNDQHPQNENSATNPITNDNTIPSNETPIAATSNIPIIQNPQENPTATPNPSTNPYKFTAYPPSTDTSPAVNAANQFGIELYARYRNENTNNIFFSPYSIFSALGMTYEGAHGQTAQEMQKFSIFLAMKKPALVLLPLSINKLTRKMTLISFPPPMLYGRKKIILLDWLLKAIETYYGGKAANLDFVSDT